MGKLPMFFNRAIAIIKAMAPGTLAAQHAKQMKLTKERYGKAGIILQVEFIVSAIPDGSKEIVMEAKRFLQGWLEKAKGEGKS